MDLAIAFSQVWILQILEIKSRELNGIKENLPFFFRRASFRDVRTPSFKDEDKIGMTPRLAVNPNADILSLILRPGATEHLAFAANVEHPGICLLSFRAPLSDTDEERAVSEQAGAKLPTVWSAHQYITVRAAANNETTISAESP
jgi:hypothetical protein